MTSAIIEFPHIGSIHEWIHLAMRECIVFLVSLRIWQLNKELSHCMDEKIMARKMKSLLLLLKVL